MKASTVLPRVGLVTAAALLLSACVTPRLYPEDQINRLTQRCGLAVGEVVQEEEEPRILFLVAPEASATQVTCVSRWAKKRALKVYHIAAVVEGAS